MNSAPLVSKFEHGALMVSLKWKRIEVGVWEVPSSYHNGVKKKKKKGGNIVTKTNVGAILQQAST